METISLGPFAVMSNGAIAPRQPHPAPCLRFAWRGRACRAELGAEGVRLAVDAARIPSTADPGADRRRAFSALAQLPASLPPGWQARLLPDHRIRVEAQSLLCAPANPIALVSAMVRFVLDLDPWLDRLEADGMAAMRAA
ncbi:hypothetical protein [Roseomonas sp. CECT 9278]|uniref:hypothetical protein n=1 Tax=Roseomonas sp. CECT 9278 TaxID=2845823 RepID=UPI001E415A4E|nr:hypothetical protein [Roseomonas sp. CECT 9278]CAH0309730.1 hypothetical protein ROS9278_04881 [Roseomonas sp. CECT 9278]